MVKVATQFINLFCVYQCCKVCYIRMAIFTTLRGEIHNSIQHKLQNSAEVDSMGIIAILGVSYITTRMVKTQTSVAKIPRVPVENQITTLSVVKIAIKFTPCKVKTTPQTQSVRQLTSRKKKYGCCSDTTTTRRKIYQKLQGNYR